MGRIYAHHAYRASFCSQIHICVSRLQVRSYTTNPRFARRYDFEEKLLSPDVSDSSTSVAKQFQSSAKMRFLHKHKAFKMKKKKKKMLVKPPSPKKNLQCFIKT
ncbi:hypothetical protein ISN44_As05g000510 [Arabidopsis suecica]|uniref:Uncharacterized protein n=1 Tax=Arabidopsis suecica TaxID=45249 RepID=A0A8T2DBK2_ARASU|nr:hypothetical protein ISN44_As05g000510 [Arabidopsis suecica]